ncbi:MAG: AAA family ATPase [Candidatus Atribacteria bacterium]|nr:AAA family ATPase [Candidatus Atribacteria bacterium]
MLEEVVMLYKKIEELYRSSETPRRKFLELLELLESLESSGEGSSKVDLQEQAHVAHCVQRFKRYGNIDEENLMGMFALVTRTIQRLFSVPPPEPLSEIATKCFPTEKKSQEQYIDVTGFLVLKPPYQRERAVILQGSHDEYGFLTFYLSKRFEHLLRSLTPGERLTLLQVKKGAKEGVYFDAPQTQIILNPDMLLDVSTLGECQVRHSRHIPELFFLKSMVSQKTSENATYGNILTVLFAMHLEKKDAPFPQLVQRFLEENPREVLLLQSLRPHLPLTVTEIIQKLGPLYNRLISAMDSFDQRHLIPEVLLLSEKIGLIGRLDFLCARENRWCIIEVKMGNPPDTRHLPWSSHWMQLTGYLFMAHNLGLPLYETSYLLYPKNHDPASVLRPLPYDQSQICALIELRNQVIQLHQRLKESPEATLTTMLNPEENLLNALPAYLRNDFQHLQKAFNEAPSLHRKYYARFFRFLLNEREYERAGTSWSPQLASLWRKTPEEKQHIFSILWDLTWDQKASKPEEGLFTFRFPQTDMYSDFRAGDMILLTPKADERTDVPFFLNGFIVTIDSSKVEIRTRFKQVFLYHLQNNPHCHLNMEHFFYDHYPHLIRSLSWFLLAPQEKRELLLGLRKPRFVKMQPPFPEGNLCKEQRECLIRAFQAEDYFLLQGPPGTGKTRVFLANLAKLFLTHTDENLLILAFTNRAVDEACSAIKKVLPSTPFLRLGSDVNTEHTDCSLHTLFGGQTPQEMLKNASKIRLVVSTVSSCLMQWDLVQLFKPTIAIVDEASQLLEPHLVGILSMMKRFILIGDEKQLPAVVVQPEPDLVVEDPELHAIGLFHLGVSLFERLLYNANQKGWHECHGMLIAQGRMHRAIQEVANMLFYDNKLCVLCEETQSRPIKEYNPESKDPFEQALASSRLIFVPTHRAIHSRVHEEEVKLVVRFLEVLERVRTNQTVGVITPFRAQVNAIRKALKKEWHTWVQVDTVERFQGSERDLIIISTAVSSEKQLPFIQSLPPKPLRKSKTPLDRKLNVAITRAREHLILLGVPELLQRVPQYENLLSYIEKQGICLQASSWSTFTNSQN